MKRKVEGQMEYNKIYKEFNKNKKFKKMKKEIHHGTSRLDHTERVAKLSYKVAKIFKCDYTSATRGALLHDFFLNEELESITIKRLRNHPYLAYQNAKKYFNINDKEKDIILVHMFPITFKKPKYKESYIVSLSDKAVSFYEFARYKLQYSVYLSLIFLIEIINRNF